MAIDSWLPVGFTLPEGSKIVCSLFEGTDWQVFETRSGGRSLIILDSLHEKWLESGLIGDTVFSKLQFGRAGFWSFSCGSNQALCPISEAKAPLNKSEALAFALALKSTRNIDTDSALQDALYVEKISRVLPTYTISSKINDDVLLGYWLTGGACISVTSFRRLFRSVRWSSRFELKEVIQAAGFEMDEITSFDCIETGLSKEESIGAKDQINIKPSTRVNNVFELPGRQDLARFFNEHVIDIIVNRRRYKMLGINFPSAVILHGPPGTGKTFAVERLIEFLRWPSFHVDASSIASPYIHETSKKIAEVFESAIENAPSVIVIDEMEAFLANRDVGTGHHRVEEMAEFLRRIPEALNNEVIVIAMTNRLDMIDSAILRRGRFDHIIKVDYANELEVKNLLDTLLSSVPTEPDVDSKPLVHELTGRPLSDVAYVVREGARFAAHSGKERLDQASLLSALSTTPSREDESNNPKRRIGFV